MKLSFFRKPVHYLPPQQDGGLQEYRERILSILLTSATILGIIALVIAIIPAIQSQDYRLSAIYILCYTGVLYLSIQRRKISFRIKTISLLFIIYLLGVINLGLQGLFSDAGVFLLAFITMTSLMLGVRSGFWALLLSVATLGLAGYLIYQNVYTPQLSLENFNVLEWASSAIILVMLGLILAASTNTILQGLNASITKAKTLVLDTDRDRAQLRRYSQDLQRRLAQLRTVADIEHTISSMLDPNALQQEVVDALRDRFDLYFVGIFLFAEKGSAYQQAAKARNRPSEMEYLMPNRSSSEVILHASSTPTIPLGYRLRIGGPSGAGWSIINRRPRVNDVSSRKDEFLQTYLPMAHSELTLPLLSQEHTSGMLVAYSTQSNAFDGDEVSLFQSFADSFTTVLENARLFQQTRKDLDEIRALQRQYLQRTWAETEQIYQDLSYTYEDGFAETQKNQPEDEAPAVLRTPIRLRDYEIGEIVLETDKPGWSSEDRDFIQEIVNEAALALDNARLLDETMRRSKHDSLIAEISRSVRASTDIETILGTAIRELGRNLGASEAVITLNTSPEGVENVSREV